MMGRWTTGAWCIAAVLLIWASSNINWGGEHWKTVLQADAKGYHAYLPALIIHGDPELGFFDAMEREKYVNPDLFYDYRTAHRGHVINKYHAGTALMQSPFFLMAHGTTRLHGGDSDGYSRPYVIAINLAAIAWVLLGLCCLAALLKGHGIDDRWIAFTLLAFVLGTNLFYYAVVAPGMSHAYSFGSCTALLYLAWKYGKEPRSSLLLLGAVCLGLILLTRPVNVLILLALPILWERPIGTLRSMTRGPVALITSVLIVLAIAGLQLLYYKVATGDWFVYSYGEERFQWTEPHFLDLLFSYRKGLFIYTPLTFISLIGLWYWWDHSRATVIAWLLFFTLLTYVLGSWWNWWYGGSFGSRVYVEYLALFALPFGLALQHTSRKLRRALVIVSVLLILLCQVQTIQARYYLIHWEDMDRERYWEEFLRIDRLP